MSTALVVVLVVVAVIVVLIAVAAVVVIDRRNDSPKERYGRTLRSIRRIRSAVRAGDPDATQIGPNRDAVIGYRSGSVGR